MVIKILSYLFGAVVVIITALLIASIFPIAGNYKILIVQSGSMEPTINTGGIVVVKPTFPYTVGDVITFGPVSNGKAPTTHRIVDIRLQNGSPVYVTKGDANEDEDQQEVLARHVIGKVLFDIPFLGYVLAAAKTPVGFAVLIVIPAGLVVIDEVYKIYREIRRIKGTKHKKT